MFGLKGRQDGYRLVFPKHFICKEIEEKYAKILQKKKGFYVRPIDFLNETIQKIQVLGITDAIYQEELPARGKGSLISDRFNARNKFMYPSENYTFRSPKSPIALIDKTLNVEFRHTLGFLNYFLLVENFYWQYMRDKKQNEDVQELIIEIFNEDGVVYSRLVLDSPVISGIDMLDLDYTQPIANSQTFKVEFKYSNFDLQFLEIEEEPENSKIIV